MNNISGTDNTAAADPQKLAAAILAIISLKRLVIQLGYDLAE
jgi:hypothetical protein